MNMSEPQALYRQVLEEERQVRELMQSQGIAAHDTTQARFQLLATARQFANTDPTFAATKELEQGLWKSCFYKRIEDFRRLLRQNGQSNGQSVRHELQALFRDASAFYDLLRSLYQGALVSAIQSDDDASIEATRRGLYRCFIFLGDLSRYREQHSTQSKKQFVTSHGYYRQALAILPQHGNAHNQLAVLATYNDAETVAIYHYALSLSVLGPEFPTAMENLSLVFSKSKQKPLISFPKSLQSSKDKTTGLKSVLQRINRLHGALLKHVTSDGTQDRAYPEDMVQSLCQDLSKLLYANVVSDVLLVKLIAIGLFLIERAFQGQNESNQRNTLKLAASLVGTTMHAIVHKLEEGVEVSKALQHLPPVLIFIEYLYYHPSILSSRAAMDGNDRFTSIFQRLLTHKVVENSDVEDGVSPEVLQLREHVELRGFAPIKELWKEHAEWRDATMFLDEEAMSVLYDEKNVEVKNDWKLRLQSLLHIGREMSRQHPTLLVIPPSSSEVKTEKTTEISVEDTGVSRWNWKELMQDKDDWQETEEVGDEVDDEVIVFQPFQTQVMQSTWTQSVGEKELEAVERANLEFAQRPSTLQPLLKSMPAKRKSDGNADESNKKRAPSGRDDVWNSTKQLFSG